MILYVLLAALRSSLARLFTAAHPQCQWYETLMSFLMLYEMFARATKVWPSISRLL